MSGEIEAEVPLILLAYLLVLWILASGMIARFLQWFHYCLLNSRCLNVFCNHLIELFEYAMFLHYLTVGCFVNPIVVENWLLSGIAQNVLWGQKSSKEDSWLVGKTSDVCTLAATLLPSALYGLGGWAEKAARWLCKQITGAKQELASWAGKAERKKWGNCKRERKPSNFRH